MSQLENLTKLPQESRGSRSEDPLRSDSLITSGAIALVVFVVFVCCIQFLMDVYRDDSEGETPDEDLLDEQQIEESLSAVTYLPDYWTKGLTEMMTVEMTQPRPQTFPTEGAAPETQTTVRIADDRREESIDESIFSETLRDM
jgi:hypothetical protein